LAHTLQNNQKCTLLQFIDQIIRSGSQGQGRHPRQNRKQHKVLHAVPNLNIASHLAFNWLIHLPRKASALLHLNASNSF